MFDIVQWANSGPGRVNHPSEHAVIGLQMKYANNMNFKILYKYEKYRLPRFLQTGVLGLTGLAHFKLGMFGSCIFNCDW